MFEYSIDELILLPLMLISIILIAVLLRIFLKNTNERIKAIPLQVIAGIILVLEIIKQILNIINGFSAWALPFHYCSMFVFFFPFAQFSKGKVQRLMKPVAFTTALAMFLLFYFNPSSIIGDSCSNLFGSFGNFHTFTFHHLIILYVFVSILLNNYKPQKKDYICLLIVMSAYYVGGITLAHIFNVNYCNFLTSNISFMELIRTSAGQIIYSIAMFFVIVGGTTLLNFLFYLLCQTILKIKTNKKNVN